MLQAIRYSEWILSICATFCLLVFSSCDQMEPAPRPDADAPARVVFSADLARWDAPATKAGESGTAWNNGSAVFFTLKSGDQTLMVRVLYYAGSDEWTIDRVNQQMNGFTSISASDLAPFSSGTCACYYFENRNGDPLNWFSVADNRPCIGLDAFTACYGDKAGKYSVTDGQITITAHLVPLTGRIRFTSPANANGRWYGAVYGVRSYSRYDLFTGELINSTSGGGTYSYGADEQTPYYYGSFDNPDKKALTVYGSTDNAGSYFYERSFAEDILAPGLSNSDKMPSPLDHNEWYMYEYSIFPTYNDGHSYKYVVPGTFQMGGDDAGPVHQVTLTRGFYMSLTEVTRNVWYNVMGSPSSYSGSSLPVTGKTWDEVQEFIAIYNAKTGYNLRLPTEAEWEYAARGAANSGGYRFSGSDKCSDVAVRDGSGNVVATASKTANEWSFYDMSGNASEWVNDWFGEYPDGPVVDPTGPASGTVHVRRGGNRRQPESYLTVTYRDRTAELEMTGFRLVFDAPKIQ